MIPLDDKRWENLNGGYGKPYDPRPALRRLESGGDNEAAWSELWNELHHQGDVGAASYAAVPHLLRIQAESSKVDGNFYALISTIEIERHRIGNPRVPGWLVESYRNAWGRVVELGTRDLQCANEPEAVAAILGALALAKGQLKLGAFVAHSDPSEIDDALEERAAWAESYDDQGQPTNLT